MTTISELEQAAFEPNNLVPGIGCRPDKMLALAGVFSYADAPPDRLRRQLQADSGQQAEVPRGQRHSKDGVGRTENVSDPVYAPNSYGGPKADPGNRI